MRQLIEVLKGKYNRDMTFKDTIDLASSICLDEYFGTIYPGFPVMKTKITRKNQAENVRAAFDYFAGRKNQQATLMLQSFGLLDGDKIRPEGSKYASYYIDMIKKLQPQGVLNYSDIFQPANDNMFEDKEFQNQLPVYTDYLLVTGLCRACDYHTKGWQYYHGFHIR